MNNKAALLLIYCIILVMILTGCNDPGKVEADIKSQGNHINPVDYRIQDFVSLDKSSNLYAGLMRSESVLTYQASVNTQFGPLDFDNIGVASYEGTDLNAIIIPVIQEKQGVFFIVYYDKEIREFKKGYIWDISHLKMSNNKSSSEPFELSGTISVYSADAELISGAVYQDNCLNNVRNSTSTRVDWNCFANCFGAIWYLLPLYIQLGCNSYCSVCIFGSPSPYTCALCVGCLAGYGTGCYIACSY